MLLNICVSHTPLKGKAVSTAYSLRSDTSIGTMLRSIPSTREGMNKNPDTFSSPGAVRP